MNNVVTFRKMNKAISVFHIHRASFEFLCFSDLLLHFQKYELWALHYHSYHFTTHGHVLDKLL